MKDSTNAFQIINLKCMSKRRYVLWESDMGALHKGILNMVSILIHKGIHIHNSLIITMQILEYRISFTWIYQAVQSNVKIDKEIGKLFIKAFYMGYETWAFK